MQENIKCYACHALGKVRTYKGKEPYCDKYMASIEIDKNGNLIRLVACIEDEKDLCEKCESCKQSGITLYDYKCEKHDTPLNYITNRDGYWIRFVKCNKCITSTKGTL